MSAILSESMSADAGFHAAGVGPATRRRLWRSAACYALICAVGLLPWFLDTSAAWRALGLGLLLPGGGLLALGPWGLPGMLLVLGLFWLSVIVWFWCGMVLAPLGIWLGSAVLAGWLVEGEAWSAAPPLVILTMGALLARQLWRARHRARVDAARLAARQAFVVESVREVRAQAVVQPDPAPRELSVEQLASVRYALERALQPVGEYAGYTIIDQFQPAALRYQINHLGYALGMVQCHYTPNFHGYLAQAQRNLIETYLQRRVWDYWVLESMWGHLNFTNFDPAARDNIMLTGYFGMQVNQYMLNTGDRRYAEPGSLTFRLNARTAYPHDAHTLVESVRMNHARSDFCLYPCEPNWIYAVCNMYGMGALASHDAVFGTRFLEGIYPRWQAMLDREFTDAKGSLIPLRSVWTGFGIPFYNGEAGFAFFANVFAPELATRLWAVGRKELSFCIAPDAQGLPRLSIPPEALTLLETIDPGNYRRGALFAYAAVAMCGCEFGDHALAEAAIRSMDQDCGRVVEHGVASYTGGSGWANIWALDARIMQTGDFRRSFVEGPPASALAGPLLEEAPYPGVLVSKALSNGEDLQLVLHPGGTAGTFPLGFSRLRPGTRYVNRGEANSPDLHADAAGRAVADIRIDGRTALHFVPA